MPQRLDDLYHEFFRPLELSELKSSIEDNHKILIDHLSKEDWKIVLRIIYALEMICNYQTKKSFIQGCGHSFMPMESKRIIKDAWKNSRDIGMISL